MTEEAKQAAMVTDYAKIREKLWMLIAVCKQIAHTIPARERTQMLNAAMRAEEALK